MITKTVLLLVTIVGLVFAVDVNVNVKPYSKNDDNIAAFDQFLKTKRNFTADNKQGLNKQLHEDWILANNYAKSMTSFDKALLTNMVNRHLAKYEVEKIQKSIVISDDISKSYYLDNLKDYKLKPLVHLEMFTFKTLEEADACYRYSQEHNYTQVLEYAKQKDFKLSDYKYPTNKMMPAFRLSMKDLKETGYFTLPQFFRKRFLVLYVNNIEHREGYVPYEKAKGHIVKMLHKQSYLKKRNELLKAYQDAK